MGRNRETMGRNPKIWAAIRALQAKVGKLEGSVGDMYSAVEKILTNLKTVVHGNKREILYFKENSMTEEASQQVISISLVVLLTETHTSVLITEVLRMIWLVVFNGMAKLSWSLR